MEARVAHNHEVPGSSPGPATNTKNPNLMKGIFCLSIVKIYIARIMPQAILGPPLTPDPCSPPLCGSGLA